MSSTHKAGFAYGCYRHRQTTPSTNWIVKHSSMTAPFVTCQVHVDGVLTVIIPVSVELIDATTVSITFSTPRTGEVVIY